jgi:hypothetical protein
MPVGRWAAIVAPALVSLGCSSPQSCAERSQVDQGECRKLMEAMDRERCVEAAVAKSAQCERAPASGR